MSWLYWTTLYWLDRLACVFGRHRFVFTVVTEDGASQLYDWCASCDTHWPPRTKARL